MNKRKTNHFNNCISDKIMIQKWLIILFCFLFIANKAYSIETQDFKNCTLTVSNIQFSLQPDINKLTQKYNVETSADEVIAIVMNSATGEVLALASSKTNLEAEDDMIPHINAIEYQFEPSSIAIPINIALALENRTITIDDTFNAYNDGNMDFASKLPQGKYTIDRFTIKDQQKLSTKRLSVADIILYSSRIGALQIVHKMNATELIDGLKKFGITHPTGINLPFENAGVLPDIKSLSMGEKEKKDNIYKAVLSYGEGFSATLMQLVKAYSVFNNNGFSVTPQIGNKLAVNELQKNPMITQNNQVLTSNTAKNIKNLLKQQFGNSAISKEFVGLDMGGVEAKSPIVNAQGYTNRYIYTFIGFANDKFNNNYIIGLSIRNPKNTFKDTNDLHIASKTLFGDIIQTMVQLEYLKY